MKLSPPGSSSDLEAARAIARRLHQRAFASNTGVEVSPRPELPPPNPPARRPAPPPLPVRPAPPPVVRPTPPPEPELRFKAAPSPKPTERPWSEPPPPRAVRTEEPEPPTAAAPERWAEPPREARATEPALADDAEQDVEVEVPAPTVAGFGASTGAEDLEDDALADLTGGAGDDLDDLASGGPRFEDQQAGAGGPSFEEPEIEEPSFAPPPVEEPSFEEPSFEGPGAGEPSDDGLELEGPEQEAPAYEPQGYEPQAYEETPYEEPAPSPGEVSPEDLIGSPTESPDVWSEESPLDSELGAPGGVEDLVEVATPSWDDVAETCRAHAGARGSMLVAASGQLLSAQGDWPNPGPEAIAGRLVAMMERALRDAPTRSVSAPLAGQHLTAWRVPVADGLLTAVFIGDSPLKADVRPVIDDEIRRAGGL